jgi:hypothetical protein
LAGFSGPLFFQVSRGPPVQPPPEPPPVITASNAPVPNAAETAGNLAPSGTEVAEAAFSAMCETPAGMCPQRSQTPIIVGSACTCSDGSKSYSGVIRLAPSK